MIRIMPIGGYNEFGRNMTAVNVDGDVVIFDMGLDVEKYVTLSGDDDKLKMSRNFLIKDKIIPDDSIISAWKKNVKAIVIGHGHLDHLGAVPFLEKNYDAPIICTAYTGEIIRTIARDDNHTIKNKIITIGSNESYHLSDELAIEFVNMTHSIPDTVMATLKTKYGVIAYANDFKLDDNPMLGKKPNYAKMEKMGNDKVIALIIDGTGASYEQKTPSEAVAKEMLKDILLSKGFHFRSIIVTTFSSHIARLKSIVEFSKKINRKPVFLGRSMCKYIDAAETVELVEFSKDAEMIRYKSAVKKFLKTVMQDKSHKKYLFVCTGHQGEPESVLGRISNGTIHFDINQSDAIIFSCRVIPTPTNIENRAEMERQLALTKVMMFRDVHVSGHASRDDQRVLIEMLKPKNVIPAHGSMKMTEDLVKLSETLGYKRGKTVHHLHDGLLLEINE